MPRVTLEACLKCYLFITQYLFSFRTFSSKPEELRRMSEWKKAPSPLKDYGCFLSNVWDNFSCKIYLEKTNKLGSHKWFHWAIVFVKADVKLNKTLMKCTKLYDMPCFRDIWSENDISDSHILLWKAFIKAPRVRADLRHKAKRKERMRVKKKEREDRRGISEGRRSREWERKRTAWHLRHHINSLNRCDIIIKLAMRSLFSSGPPLVLALKTKPLAFVQASFQALREMMTDIKRFRKKYNSSYMKTH